MRILDPDRTEVVNNADWLGADEPGRHPRLHPPDDGRPAARARRLRPPLRRAASRSACPSSSTRCCRASTRSRSAPTSSSAAPTRRSTTWSAANCSAPGARRRRPSSPCRCSSAPTAWRRWASRSATTSRSTSRPTEQFGKLMSIPDSVVGMYARLCTALHPREVDELEAEVAAGGAGGQPGQARDGPRGGRAVPRRGRGRGRPRSASTPCSSAARSAPTRREPRSRAGDPVHLPAALVAAGLAASTERRPPRHRRRRGPHRRRRSSARALRPRPRPS